MNKYKNICSVLGVNVALTDMTKTIEFLTDNLEDLRGEYICVSNSHTIVMAHDDMSYMNIQNSSALVLPDGKPLSFVQKMKGHKTAQRVCGPDLMSILTGVEYSSYRHFFYGSTEETISQLKETLVQSNPRIQIAGMYSPPFRPLTNDENIAIVNLINDSNPDFIWVGIGAPKQEIWMYNHSLHSLESKANGLTLNGIMLGVGAAFDFQARRKRRAPIWMQNIGLEWLYRLIQDPKRLFKRYLITNSKFIFYCICQEFNSLFGKHGHG